MSTTYPATESRQASVSAQRATGLLGKCLDAFVAWRLQLRLRSTLEELSDRELRDIGVTRGEIDYLTRNAISVDPRLR